MPGPTSLKILSKKPSMRQTDMLPDAYQHCQITEKLQADDSVQRAV